MDLEKVTIVGSHDHTYHPPEVFFICYVSAVGFCSQADSEVPKPSNEHIVHAQLRYHFSISESGHVGLQHAIGGEGKPQEFGA